MNFKNDATEARANAYGIGFIDYRDKVAWAYPELHLSGIVVDSASPKEEEGREGAEAEKENAGATKNRLVLLRRELRVSFLLPILCFLPQAFSLSSCKYFSSMKI